MVHNYYPESSSHPSSPQGHIDNGVVSVLLGAGAVFFAFMPFVGIIAWPLSISGLVFGKFALNSARRGETGSRTGAISGLALSAFALLVCTGWLVFTVVAIASS